MAAGRRSRMSSVWQPLGICAAAVRRQHTRYNQTAGWRQNGALRCSRYGQKSLQDFVRQTHTLRPDRASRNRPYGGSARPGGSREVPSMLCDDLRSAGFGLVYPELELLRAFWESSECVGPLASVVRSNWHDWQLSAILHYAKAAVFATSRSPPVKTCRFTFLGYRNRFHTDHWSTLRTNQ